MNRTPVLALSAAWILMASTASISAQELSRYRQFQLGANVDAVERLEGTHHEAGVPKQGPEQLIQELIWLPTPASGAPAHGDSVRQVLLSFYDDQLYRIVVSYAWERTEGLTVDDMVEALSLVYGPPMLSATAIVPSSAPFSAGAGGERVVARWEDMDHLLHLVRPAYASTFGLVMVSKPLDALVAMARMDSLATVEADTPERGIERRRMQEEKDRARQEHVRRTNKAAFRP